MVQKEADFGSRVFERRIGSWWHSVQFGNAFNDQWVSDEPDCGDISLRNLRFRISLAWSLRITGILCFAANLGATLLLRDRNHLIKPAQLGFATHLLRRTEVILLLVYSFLNMLGYVSDLISKKAHL